MPHIYSFRYFYPSTIMFNYVHTLGTMCDELGGIEERNTVQYVAMLFLSMLLILNFDSYFIGELNMMNT
jgi:hypothetical protein